MLTLDFSTRIQTHASAIPVLFPPTLLTSKRTGVISAIVLCENEERNHSHLPFSNK